MGIFTAKISVDEAVAIRTNSASMLQIIAKLANKDEEAMFTAMYNDVSYFADNTLRTKKEADKAWSCLNAVQSILAERIAR